jgi:SWIRM domain
MSSSWITPEQTIYDNFGTPVSKEVQSDMPSSMKDNQRVDVRLPSPPVSPPSKAPTNTPENSNAGYWEKSRDPILFQQSKSGDALAPEVPLFPRSPVFEPAQTSEVHNAQSNKLALGAILNAAPEPKAAVITPSPPTKEEVELFANFASNAWSLYNRNPRAWLAQERKYNARLAPRVNVKGAVQKSGLSASPFRPLSLKKDSHVGRTERVKRPAKEPKPRVRAENKNGLGGARPSKGREDFWNVENYSPDPWETLPDNSNAMGKPQWPSPPKDLRNDPNFDKLHPAEVTVAQCLNLSAGRYLYTKRKIFANRLKYYREGRGFGKTNAQEDCGCDVNKASKLWDAFTKVGWGDGKHMEKFA